MDKKFLEEKLSEIESAIKENYAEKKDIGVLSGLSGMAMFQYYYAKYLNSAEKEELAEELLVESINKINNGYTFPTYCTGIAGAGWVIDHLEMEKLISLESDELLAVLDDYLYEMLQNQMKSDNYDFLHGAIGYAYYFYNRYRNTKSDELKVKYKNILNEFIDLLEEMAEKEDETLYKWKSPLRVESVEDGFNFSLSHGISSIIVILSKLYQLEEFKDKTSHLLNGAVGFVLKYQKTEDDINCKFPNWVDDKEQADYNSRLAWCYGDIGIASALWQAAKVLNDDTLKANTIKIFEHASQRRTMENTYVNDAGVCHGSYGNAQVFYNIYKETQIPLFKETTDFWILKGIEMAVHTDGFAGYKRWDGVKQKWHNEVDLLEGVAGIGLTIIDYLADFDTNWDECLMIS